MSLISNLLIKSKLLKDRRRSRRFPLKTKVYLVGNNPGGLQTAISAETLLISRQGGSLAVSERVDVGDVLVMRDQQGHAYWIQICWTRLDRATQRRTAGFKIRGDSQGWARTVVSQLRRRDVVGTPFQTRQASAR